MMKHRLIGTSGGVLVVTLALALGSPSEVYAQGNPNAAAAQAMFEEARALMASGNFAEACKKLEGSQSLDPGPGTEFNLALCYEKSGKSASAWASYLNAAAAYKASNRPDWEERARSRAAALSKSLSRLTINGPPSPAPVGMTITRDGKPVLGAELGTAIPMDPGTHVIEAQASGRPKYSARVDVLPGATEKTLNIVFADPAPATEDGHPPSPSPPPHDTTEPSDSSRKLVAYVLGGVGVAGLAFGGISGLVALNKNSTSLKDCPNDGICGSSTALDANDSARGWATASTIGFIAGAAFIAAGAILYFTAPKSSRRASTAAASSASGFVLKW